MAKLTDKVQNNLVLAPAAYHRILADGEDTHELVHFVSRVVSWALLPLAVALGLDVYGAIMRFHGWRAGSIGGILTVVAALGGARHRFPDRASCLPPGGGAR